MKQCIFVIIFLFFISNSYGFHENIIAIDDGHIKYYQIGTGKPVLLLHGLFANKEQWLGLIERLQQIDSNITQKYQFIIPDLPGYGGSTDYPIGVYNLDSANNHISLNEVRILHDFIKQLQITVPINIAGNSMGGLLAVLYAVHYPTEVKSIAFIGSPAGMTNFTDKFFNIGFRRGYNPFIPTTVKEFKSELYLLLINYKNIMPSDDYIKTKIIPKEEENYKKYTAAFNMLYPYKDFLKNKLSLQQPMIIFWGKKDYIFGSDSYAIKLCNNFVKSKKCEHYSLARAGHLLLKEDNKTLSMIAKNYQLFLDGFN